jgi:HK97 family phage prohead protease
MATTREPPALVTRGEAMCVRAMRVEERTAEFVASTDAVDSHGDVVDQESWQLAHFKANPIVLYGHNSRELPIGMATKVGVKNGQLEATIKFASAAANPRAEEVWQLVQEGVLRAVSVGFLPTDGRYEMRDGNEVFVWRSPVLKEISVVPVPANHEALARIKAAFVAANNSENPALPGSNRNAEEVQMDPKEMQSKIEKQAAELGERDAKIKALESENKSLGTEKAALEAQNKALVEARDKAEAKAAGLEDAVIEQEVEALVGRKIAPAQKKTYLALRKSNPDLFKEMVEQLGELKLDTVVTPKEREVAKARSLDSGADAFLANVKKAAGL